MERRNRNILVILIAIVIVVAMFSSFGLSLFTGRTTPIILPPEETDTLPDVTPHTSGKDEGPVSVDVTPDTVQNVIATLSRPESYYRQITIDDYWSPAEHGRTTAKVWVHDHVTKVIATNYAGLTRTSISGNGKLEVRYSSGSGVLSVPSDEYTADLEGQRIPTYEDVLSLSKDQIIAAGFREKSGQPCVYVETVDTDLGYRDCYWVSSDTGLLVAAETWDADELLYSMYSDGLERPCPADELPLE